MPPSIESPIKSRRSVTQVTAGTIDGSTPEQLLDTTKIAVLPVNVNLEEPARIEERTGRLEKLDTGTDPIVIDEKFTNTLRIVGYGTTLSFWNLNTNTEHNIKTDFSANLKEGVREGEAFYTCNGREGDKIYKTTLPTLGYNTQTVNFTVGQVVTDSVTGATATIIADSDSGATGTLTLDNINGTFGANIITDPLGGSATSDGAVDFTNTSELSNAPKCESIFYFDGSIVAGNTDTDKSEWHVAKKGDPTTWTPSATAGEPYKESFGRLGELLSFGTLDNQGIQNLGNQIFVGFEDGYIVGHNSIVDVGGTLTQRFIYDATKKNAGANATASTAKGVYYTNENGVFFRVVGQDRNSDDINVSHDIGRELKDFSFEGSKLLFIPENKRLLIICKRGADQNNAVLVHNTETTFTRNKAWWRYEGWRLNTIKLDRDTVYGGSSLDGKLYQLFTGTNDNGSPIRIFYEQYLNVFPKDTVGDCYRMNIGGKVTKGSPYTITLDIINEIGQRTSPPNNTFEFDSDAVVSELAGLGKAGLGYTGLGGTTFSDPSAFSKKWFPSFIQNFTSLILTIESTDSQPGQINWVSVETEPIRQQFEGLLTQT